MVDETLELLLNVPREDDDEDFHRWLDQAVEIDSLPTTRKESQ